MDNRIKNAAQKDRKGFVKFIILLLFVAACVAVTIWLLPWIISLKDEAGRVAFEEYIQSKGAWGILILLGVQIMQVVIAIIPGEPIEVISGLLYGTVGGWLICTVGVLIGTVVIYYIVKLLGVSFIQKIVNIEKFERFKFLKDAHRLEAVTFLLFFIPGTPKDLLTYFMPMTTIKPLTFFWISAVARVPSIISSTWAGASLGEGKWIQTILIFVGIGLIGILGIWLNDRLITRANRSSKKRDADRTNTSDSEKAQETILKKDGKQ